MATRILLYIFRLVQEDVQLMLTQLVAWRLGTIKFSIRDGNNQRAVAKLENGLLYKRKFERTIVTGKKDVADMVGLTKVRHRKIIGWKNDLTDEEADHRWLAAFQIQSAEGKRIMCNGAGEAMAHFADDPRERCERGWEDRETESIEDRSMGQSMK